MKIFIERGKKKLEKSFKGTAKDLMKDLKVNPEEVLIVRNGTVVTEDEKLEKEDKIEFLSVVSGG